jgi:FkbM family methyltransferase
VLDIGGHKGYFGAYALAHGAASVLTFEPAERNYRVLERTAKPLRARWSVHKAALGSNTGTGVLLLDKTSWAHSLVSVERPAGEQRVRIETLEHALSELSNRGARTIVKVDAEGSECEILARPGTLENVDLVMVEWHPETAPCTTDDLARVAASAGLVRGVDRGVLRFERR